MWKKDLDFITQGDGLGLSGYRLAPAGKADLAVRSGWKMDQRRKAAALRMVLVRSNATEPQWRRINPRKAQQRAAV
ncbi:MAG: hypothetical protein GY792_34595 [Gammaproteobacteria bacterium]|nr:hypothetical protein [Gammaproteobacteria bacterium]